MYTQCPECEVAFRVTADVLKQAAGKVRCGGCGEAFNALAHLSEEMPANAATENPPGEAGTPPQSISAEQSAALLKTLDQLAGEDIRIEDTGVEWRVIDVDEDQDIADDPVPSVVHDEMRFDDNTPLPDDFDLDTPSAPPPPLEPVVEETEPEPQIEESQIDLLFGEPDEWEDLLEDLEEVAAEIEIAPPEDDMEVVEARAIDDADAQEPEVAELVVEELVVEEPDLDDSDFVEPGIDDPDAEPEPTPEIADQSSSDADADLDAQFARQAEELGLDLTGMQEALDQKAIEEASGDDDEPEEDSEEELVLELEDDEEIDSGDTSIEEEDLIAAAFEVEAAAKAEAEEEEEPETEEAAEDDAPVKHEINLDDVAPEELSRAGILDEDDYLEHITEEDEANVLDEIALEASPADQALADALLDDEPVAEDISDEDSDIELVAEEALDDEDQFPDEEELAADLEEALEEMQNVEYSEPEEVEVPELTEEEKTVNMMIDQDLLAIAVEDDDGFTSTIVQKQVSNDADIPPERSADDTAEAPEELAEDKPVEAAEDADDAPDDAEAESDDADAMAPFAAAANDSPLMETIIMEGESVMNEEDQERLEAARAAASESLKEGRLRRGKVRASTSATGSHPRHSAAAAAAVLFRIAGRAGHPSFTRGAWRCRRHSRVRIGPVYRMFGSPVITRLGRHRLALRGHQGQHQ